MSLQGFELRFENALREWIQEEMSGYIEELDAIELHKTNAIALFASARGGYNKLEDVLIAMDEIKEKLSKE